MLKTFWPFICMKRYKYVIIVLLTTIVYSFLLIISTLHHLSTISKSGAKLISLYLFPIKNDVNLSKNPEICLLISPIIITPVYFPYFSTEFSTEFSTPDNKKRRLLLYYSCFLSIFAP